MDPTTWTTEWIFIIGMVIAAIAVYVNRDKVFKGGGKGSKTPGGPKPRRK